MLYKAYLDISPLASMVLMQASENSPHIEFFQCVAKGFKRFFDFAG